MFPLVPPSKPETSYEPSTPPEFTSSSDPASDLVRPSYPDVRYLALGGLPSLGKRLVAVLLDILLGAVAAVVGLVIFGNLEGRREPSGILGAMLLGLVPLYVCQFVLLTTSGQTLGKKLVGTRIVRYDNGDNPGFGRAVVLRTFLPGLLCAIPFVGPLFGLVNILFIFGEERRCLHDYLAGTQVVEA